MTNKNSFTFASLAKITGLLILLSLPLHAVGSERSPLKEVQEQLFAPSDASFQSPQPKKRLFDVGPAQEEAGGDENDGSLVFSCMQTKRTRVLPAKRTPLGRGSFGQIYVANTPEKGTPLAVKYGRDVVKEGRILEHIHRDGPKVGVQESPCHVGIDKKGEEFFIGHVYNLGDLAAFYADPAACANFDLYDRIAGVYQLLLGLSSTYLDGLVHTDVKAENIFLDKRGKLFIVVHGDLGGAISIDQVAAAQKGALTMSYVLSSDRQVPREQMKQSIFSNGLAIHYLLTGSSHVGEDKCDGSEIPFVLGKIKVGRASPMGLFIADEAEYISALQESLTQSLAKLGADALMIQEMSALLIRMTHPERALRDENPEKLVEDFRHIWEMLPEDEAGRKEGYSKLLGVE